MKAAEVKAAAAKAAAEEEAAKAPMPPQEPREEEPPEEPEAPEEVPEATAALVARSKDEAEAVAAEVSAGLAGNGAAYLDDTKLIVALQGVNHAGGAAIVQALVASEVNVLALAVRALPAMLDLAGSKKAEVSGPGSAAVDAICEAITAESYPNILPYLIEACSVHKAPATRLLALGKIGAFRTKAPEETFQCMNQLVPVLSACMTDSKKDVKEAAIAAMDAVSEVIGNNDIEPALPDLKGCIVRPQETEDCIFKLSATTFVQPVTSAAMSILVPLLVRGLRERVTALRRQTCKIIMNMAKLVENPPDAAPFLPEIMPLLERTVETVSDPEARSVCRRAYHQMLDLQNSCITAPLPPLTKHKMMTMLGEQMGDKVTDFAKKTMKFVADAILALGAKESFQDAKWDANVAAALAPYAGAEKAAEIKAAALLDVKKRVTIEEDEEEEDDAELLCDCQFTLAYGTNVLLNNTKMKLKRGFRYGLLGANDCGKTTLMRAISNGQVEGFPDPSEVRTVFVEADILGELSHLNVTDYVVDYLRLKGFDTTREQVQEKLISVGFAATSGHGTAVEDAVSTLSGGWRMKLAIARAMLQNADILLMDEPTNHLDVMNVAWVKTYLLNLKDVTSILVSHDSGLLTDVCTHIMEFRSLKLHVFKGNLTEFVRVRPEARAYFEFKATRLKFTFPQPTYIEGVKSRATPLMRVTDASLTYPGNTRPTIEQATVSVSRASRVACIGPNGAGKSTLIKVLTGEVEPTTGTVWHHPMARIGYIAQHAFHHIEQHLSKTPNEYIRWRYQGGQDKENISRDTMILTDEEKALQTSPIEYQWEDEDGEIHRANRVIEKLTGARRQEKNSRENEYEVKFKNMSHDHNGWILQDKLEKKGFTKNIKKVDAKIAAQSGLQAKPLTMENVAQHLENVGLEREFGSHCRIGSLSGGQKVKVVLAAALWMCPHIIILDEPTNYLDRESLGALAGAITEFEGGVVIISHNNDFVGQLCPVTWVVEKDPDGISRPDSRGDENWMASALEKKQDEIQQQVLDAVVTDAYGNETKVVQKKKLSKKELKKKTKEILKKINAGLELDEDEEKLADEHGLYAEAAAMDAA